MQNYYDMLDITSESTQDEIRRAITRKKNYIAGRIDSTDSRETIERYQTELFFLKKVETTLLDVNHKSEYDLSLKGETRKRKLDVSDNTSPTVDQSAVAAPADAGNSTSAAPLRLLEGVVINQVFVSKHTIPANKVYLHSLLKTLCRVSIIALCLLLVVWSPFWGTALIVIWNIRAIRHTPLSRILASKAEEYKLFFRELLQDLQVTLLIRKAAEQSGAHTCFVVRDKENRVIKVRVKGPLSGGSLNVGDPVKLFCFGLGESVHFVSGSNLRNGLSLRFTRTGF